MSSGLSKESLIGAPPQKLLATEVRCSWVRSPGPRTVILRASPAGDTMVNRVVSSSEEEDRSMGCEDEPIVAAGGGSRRERPGCCCRPIVR